MLVLLFFYLFAFKNSALNSASVANAATNFSIVQRVKITPLRRMGCLYCGVHPRKKFPAAWMRASLSDKYHTSEWAFRSMYDAQYRIVVFGYVPRELGSWWRFVIVCVVALDCSLANVDSNMIMVVSMDRA